MFQERTRASKEIPLKKWQQKIHEIIFEADTPAGKLFDVSLLVAIVISTLAVMLETVKEVNQVYAHEFWVLEWIITAFFSLEYLARLISVKRPLRYAFSFYGIIDLLSILPTFLGLFIYNANALRVIRVIRLLRIFRIFKLGRYLREAELLGRALSASRWKIIVFFGVVIMICIVMGAVMYVIEGNYQPGKGEGFTSIPRSIYWAIVTLTTVGYGDISPVTPLGQTISSLIMILGYAILAVPTGIVSVEFGNELRKENEEVSRVSCNACAREGHAPDAKYCKYCGNEL